MNGEVTVGGAPLQEKDRLLNLVLRVASVTLGAGFLGAAALMISAWYAVYLLCAGVGLTTWGTVAPGGLLRKRLLANGRAEVLGRVSDRLRADSGSRRRQVFLLGIVLWSAILMIATAFFYAQRLLEAR